RVEDGVGDLAGEGVGLGDGAVGVEDDVDGADDGGWPCGAGGDEHGFTSGDETPAEAVLELGDGEGAGGGGVGDGAGADGVVWEGDGPLDDGGIARPLLGEGEGEGAVLGGACGRSGVEHLAEEAVPILDLEGDHGGEG